jgi:hypothetical protein
MRNVGIKTPEIEVCSTIHLFFPSRRRIFWEELKAAGRSSIMDEIAGPCQVVLLSYGFNVAFHIWTFNWSSSL